MTFAGTWSVKATTLGFGILKLRLSARNTEGNASFLWRTPDAHCDRGFRKTETFLKRVERGMPLQLNDQVAHLLPIPTANDAKNNGSPANYHRHTPPLGAVADGSLNPEWVGWLMGFPEDWTNVD